MKRIIKYEVLQDCYCEYYLHESSYHYRKGLIGNLLTKGQIVTQYKHYKGTTNSGGFIDVKCDKGFTYEIPPRKLRLL